MSLARLRKEIEKLDRQLLETLARRFDGVNQIARLKEQGKLPVFSREREEVLYRNYKEWAQKLDLSQKMVKSLFQIILKESRQVQRRLRKK